MRKGYTKDRAIRRQPAKGFAVSSNTTAVSITICNLHCLRLNLSCPSFEILMPIK